ncbi:glycosyltransferase [Methanosphaera sp. ISO3-F5]|uniref:glycosyltransferase n=1 Tax=Methanosphaera sp. ISO3-F5 TaxID=1452353 RepID=UPI002B26070B|nr:glycosyltransferase [Methanosphaera sp. ISO3-F5]WQH63400.1 glycosyltransferase [Methanosphaera sp. ISO3-F5]
MFSIICVYNNKEILNEYLLNSLSQQDSNYDLILINNEKNRFYSATSALNYGAKKAKGDYLLFVHQDVKFIGTNWLSKTELEIKKLDKIGAVGVLGKKDIHLYTNILMGEPPRRVSDYTLKTPLEIKTLDECLIIIPKKVFNKHKFDEKTCDDWHLYGTDYVLSIKKEGYKSYVIPTNLIHRSIGDSLSETYYQLLPKLQKKHFPEKIIYTSCGDWYTFIPIFLQRILKIIIYLILMYVLQNFNKENGWNYIKSLNPF